MGFFENTSSFTTVSQRIVSGITDTYVRCGTNVMVRKFDPAVIAPGSWNELWIGFRWRISSSYAYHTSSVFDPFEENSTFECGLCNTDGVVYGQSGSLNAPINGHNVGFFKSDHASSGTTYWELHNSQSKYALASAGGCITHRVSSSLVQQTLTTRLFGIFMNTAYFTSSYRSLFVMRAFNNLSTTAPVTNSLQFSFIYPDINNSSSYLDISSSAILADVMGATNWVTSSVSASNYGYLNSTEAAVVAVSQSVNGYFNGIYFSWRRLYDNMEISDVVVRKI
jgi:hypothetical protein